MKLQASHLDIGNFDLEFVKFFLHLCIFRSHFLVFRLPLITSGFQSLDFAFVVSGLDIGGA